MELGEKLRQAREEAGLTQRQLCGEEITRNMLSRIENGAAKPSMKTMQYLAARLGRPVSYFLEEPLGDTPNQGVMTQARQLFDAGDFRQALDALDRYQSPDPVFDRERDLLWVLCCLALAEKALEEGRDRYARDLLEKTDGPLSYCREELNRRRLLLLGRLGQPVCRDLPSLDGELTLRAREALAEGDAFRAARLLDAVQDQSLPQWNLLRGMAGLEQGRPAEATLWFHRAEPALPKETAPLLERCYRELEDYKRAYEYACLQK